jgi:hypothetical protein
MRMDVWRAEVATGVLALALVALAGPAAARDSLESKWRDACWRDAFTICTLHAISGDRSGVRDCLVRNIDHISKSCRHVIEDANNKGIHDASAPPNEPVSSAAAPARH